MNAPYFPNDPDGFFHTFDLPDFAVSWAGANPFGDGFCFGSETGQLVLTDIRGRQIIALGTATESNEAVNGVAFSQGWLAVTTRADVNLIGPWPRGRDISMVFLQL